MKTKNTTTDATEVTTEVEAQSQLSEVEQALVIENEKLIAEIKVILEKSIASGGTTFSDYRQLDGSTGKYVLELNAYGQTGKNCPVCGKPFASIRQGGRTTVYCPECQH